jgi:hypothetical protein
MLAVLAPGGSALARPILYSHSTTVMAEYAVDVMRDVQVSYAPGHYLAFGVGHLELDGGGPGVEHEINFGRLNLLVKRWNLEKAQSNIFIWGGVGRSSIRISADVLGSTGHNHGGTVNTGEAVTFNETAGNVGGQIDYETRRVYTSFATDSQFAASFTHRMDTLQFGIAPYEHEANGLATFFIVSATKYSGNLQKEETQVAVLLRMFRKSFWVEAGATTDGKPQARLMLTF